MSDQEGTTLDLSQAGADGEQATTNRILVLTNAQGLVQDVNLDQGVEEWLPQVLSHLGAECHVQERSAE